MKISRFVPAPVRRTINHLLGASIKFKGTYGSYAEAMRQADGYNAEDIIVRVKSATLMARQGGGFERDGKVFRKLEPPYPVLVALLAAAARNEGRLTVLDFGGSLGSSYQRCRPFLSRLPKVEWCVVEQKSFVECGRNMDQIPGLYFFSDLKAVLDQHGVPDAALFSGVLNYVEKPMSVLNDTIEASIPYIVLDRTPISRTGSTWLTVQHVPRSHFSASYPMWVFGREELCSPFSEQYTLTAEFGALDGVIGFGKRAADFRGFIFERKA